VIVSLVTPRDKLTQQEVVEILAEQRKRMSGD
jgi:hypothetical protein